MSHIYYDDNLEDEKQADKNNQRKENQDVQNPQL